MTLSVEPLPEQDIMRPLIDETEANRFGEELLQSEVMNSEKRSEGDASIAFSQTTHGAKVNLRPSIPFTVKTHLTTEELSE